ncbi:MAG TPA: Coenzyme F420 hydrogenase/dehydrogenase, beta subunit C-terminal domain [Rhizorhapis sp.]|nr:Coenzyme F420 hydrogenase/dehydrogenase, beta subunit C-terminal domain [Rhizorhapis sp.]
MKAASTVQRVLRDDLCSGCGLCAGISGGAIEMAVAPPGYDRPVIKGEIAPHAEAVIADSCPGSKVAPWRNDLPPSPYWGPAETILTGHARDETVRFAGSSGGAITALLLFALESGLVDRVVQVNADPAFPTRNRILVSRTAEEVLAAAGSRYAASSPLASIIEELERGGCFAFVGKPCDISALRQLANHDARVDEHIPVKLSFFCGGIPSHRGAENILAEMGLGDAPLTEFRYRGNGWPGLATARTADGRTAQMSYARSWGHHLSKEVQFRCKVCPDAVGGAADIACADAWYGGESGYPQFEEQDGRSLIMVRSTVGRTLLDKAVASGRLEVAPLAEGEVVLMQPAQARRKRLVKARFAAMRLAGRKPPGVEGLLVDEASRKAGLVEKLRNFAGTFRRVMAARP